MFVNYRGNNPCDSCQVGEHDECEGLNTGCTCECCSIVEHDYWPMPRISREAKRIGMASWWGREYYMLTDHDIRWWSWYCHLDLGVVGNHLGPFTDKEQKIRRVKMQIEECERDLREAQEEANERGYGGAMLASVRIHRGHQQHELMVLLNRLQTDHE